MRNLLFIMLLGLTACVASPPSQEVEQLLDEAYNQHYRSTDSTTMYAQRALVLCDRGEGSGEQRSEALCHLAFAHAMRMEYDSAQAVYGQVIDGDGNELVKLLADVGMMRVCQRRSANREFYDYVTRARQRMERLASEQSQMDERQLQLWNYVRSDFHLTRSIYYYYLRQDQLAQADIDTVGAHMEWVIEDAQQLALFYFLGGNSRSTDGLLGEDNLHHILQCLSVAYTAGYPYLYSKALTTLADDMVQTKQVRASRSIYLRDLLAIPDSVNEPDYSLYITLLALRELRTYGSPFDVAQTYITLSDYYLYGGQPDMALQALQRIVVPTAPDGSARCPELKVDVHEHLSMVYSALGMKAESDQHRNTYLDILDSTRQDLMTEQRLESLRSEERALNRTILIVGIVFVFLVAWVVGFSRRLRANYTVHYQREQAVVEREMEQWRERSDERFTSLTEQQEMVQETLQAGEHRLAVQKRQYVDRLTCLSLVNAITPFLDRAVAEIRKLSPQSDNTARREYLGELLERINLLNEILSHWVKVRQGEVALHIENFALQPLLDIIAKNSNAFKNKNITLDVEPTDAVVKADRALTLFMVNTLLENARKYTGEGGEVRVAVEEAEDYVEVNVSDTGRGLSPEDVETILSQKVYDPSRIGTATNDEELHRSKGNGFGLMNCKGIIEKYRKTSPQFAVCLFGIESVLGKGSRFFFRLPKGVLRSLVSLLLLLTLGACTPNTPTQPATATTDELPDNPWLEMASNYADSAYFANLDARYADALLFADSACTALNAYYLSQRPDGELLMSLLNDTSMPEITLWNEGFNTDYHIILDLRNEAAVAALALNSWDVYYYNNEVYTRLYKLMARDTTLEQYCSDIRTTVTRRQTLLIVAVLLLLLLLFAYYLTYYRNHILPTFNLRQVLELNRRLYTSDDEAQLADIIYEGVNEIRRTDGVALALNDGHIRFSRQCPQQALLQQLLQPSALASLPPVFGDGRIRFYPLQVEGNQVGVLALLLHSPQMQRGDQQLFDLLARHTAVNIYYSQVRTQRLRTAIELADDERRRAESEANHVHVQNMVLDNNLSTLKHETMYYPSRIRQMLEQGGEQAEREETIATLLQLATYYKEVFTLLSLNASRQMEDVHFHRTAVPLQDMVPHVSVVLQDDADSPAETDIHLLGDSVMLRYLRDSIMAALRDFCGETEVVVQAQPSGDFVTLTFSSAKGHFTAEQLHNMFYPENLRYDADNDSLHGAQLLIAKQIVRLHDDYVRRGCRIEARPANAKDGSGLSVCVTLPAKL